VIDARGPDERPGHRKMNRTRGSQEDPRGSERDPDAGEGREAGPGGPAGNAARRVRRGSAGDGTPRGDPELAKAEGSREATHRQRSGSRAEPSLGY
jgi:hypothetical protein